MLRTRLNERFLYLMRVLLAAVVVAGCVKSSGGLLVKVTDVELPGNATRFDYADVDAERGLMALAHMGDDELLVLSLADGKVLARVPNVVKVRGVVVAGDRIYATAMNGELVIIDAKTFVEAGRAATGDGPDGVAFDPVHQVVATSDQRAGALSLFASGGSGARTAVPLGSSESGNVVFDPARKVFWVTAPPKLIGVDPVTGATGPAFALPGCEGAHGLRLHPDGRSAFVACEDNDVLLRVNLESGATVSAPVGKGPDVLAIDAGLGRLYVAPESGDVAVFDLSREGLHELGRVHPGDHAHTVAVDQKTHRVYFPFERGPVLAIMAPP
jgi:DNA-binding beta-propeller fold protein YncE